MELPLKYKARMKELLGSEYDAFIESYEKPPCAGLRVNTLKVGVGRLRELMELRGEGVAWCPQGIYTDEPTDAARPSKSVFYSAGLFYIQEPSAMLPASVVNIEPGDKVLDLCAAPGGKSTQLAARLDGNGLLVSNDVSASRCAALVKNIELSGITNAVVINERPEKLSGRLEGFFDKVLIDAPCSGEGMFRKDRDAVKSWEADTYKSEKCRALQSGILSQGAKMLKAGGELVYSTCTFEPEENESVIAEFLEKNKLFQTVPIDCGRYGVERGLDTGASSSLTGASGAARIWPHRQRGEGHFTARLRKSEGGEAAGASFLTSAHKPADASAVALFQEFCDKYLNLRNRSKLPISRSKLLITYGAFALNGISLYLVPSGAPDLRGIRTVRSGWYLGDIKTKRFEPSQAMAMGLKAEDAAYVIDYGRNDENLTRYLRGESCEAAEGCAEGWNLVCAEGFPLGWAKVVGGRMKNKYLWRI